MTTRRRRCSPHSMTARHSPRSLLSVRFYASSLKVVLTREAGKNDSLEDWLPPDASCTEVPLTRTRYYEPQQVRDALEKSDARGRFRSLVVTSERSQPYATLAI